MKNLLISISKVLAWVVILWGCFVVAFGAADFYGVAFGGVTPGDHTISGDPAPTYGQAVGEILIGIIMIALALLYLRRIRKKMMKTRGSST